MNIFNGVGVLGVDAAASAALYCHYDLSTGMKSLLLGSGASAWGASQRPMTGDCKAELRGWLLCMGQEKHRHAQSWSTHRTGVQVGEAPNPGECVNL